MRKTIRASTASLETSWPQLAPHVRREALRVLGRFDGVADTPATKHAAPLPITRLNEHYADAMRLSRLVLQAMSLSHEAGDQQAHSLMVDMDDLFRRWISQELDLDEARLRKRA